MEITTINYPNMIVRVHRPELSAEERKKRMKEIEKAAGKLLLSERGKR